MLCPLSFLPALAHVFKHKQTKVSALMHEQQLTTEWTYNCLCYRQCVKLSPVSLNILVPMLMANGWHKSTCVVFFLWARNFKLSQISWTILGPFFGLSCWHQTSSDKILPNVWQWLSPDQVLPVSGDLWGSRSQSTDTGAQSPPASAANTSMWSQRRHQTQLSGILLQHTENRKSIFICPPWPVI